VKPGDRVKRGDVVAVVETQKGAIEIEIFESGRIEGILVELDSKVPVGTPLARIMTDEEAKSGGAAVAASPPPIVPVPAVPEILRPAVLMTPAPSIVTGTSEGRVRASPAARRLARARGVDLAAVTGSGPSGAIIRVDVERGLAGIAARTEKGRSVGLDLGAMRAAIAAAMARSKREIPHYYLAQTVSVRRALDWLARTNAALPAAERVLAAALYVRAVARALWDVPELNGAWIDGYRPSEAVHVGFAIALRGGGVLAPAIHDADQKSVAEIMADLRDLVRRARAGTVRASELADPTITISSVGDRGPDAVWGVINPPQVALVGVGAIVERPWVEAGAVVAHPTVTLTLSADHRVTDGHRGGRFLTAVDRYLQELEAP
ncbi:MAG: 2-oxo acid dehydrogenase subunit E2, partial [Kofleriaceae bacterium]